MKLDLNYDLGIIIPAKRHSTRLKDKNLLPFGNKNTLIEWKISQLLEIVPKDIIYVSSEDDQILSIAKKCGVHALNRDSILSCDNVKWSDVIVGITKNVHHQHIAWAQVTSPLMGPQEYYDHFIKYRTLDLKVYDSLMAVNVIREYFWNDYGPINYKSGIAHSPSQQLPQWYKITNGLFVISKELLLEREYYVGNYPYKAEVSKLAGIDIDYPEDYQMCQALYNLYLEEQKG